MNKKERSEEALRLLKSLDGLFYRTYIGRDKAIFRIKIRNIKKPLGLKIYLESFSIFTNSSHHSIDYFIGDERVPFSVFFEKLPDKKVKEFFTYHLNIFG